MAVGLGSGTTATLMVQRLGQRVAEEGLEFLGVPTSGATAELAASVGHRAASDLDAVDTLDLDLDGADEVDTAFRMIKGRGGALAPREDRRRGGRGGGCFIVGENKHVERLGLQVPRAGRGQPVRPDAHRARPARPRGASRRSATAADGPHPT